MSLKSRFALGLFLVAAAVVGIVVVLASENALVVHPKGIIAHQELELIIINILLMLSIIFPTYILLFLVVWKYCISQKMTKYEPEHKYGIKGQLIMWALPAVIVIALSIVTWDKTHKLNPYKPLEGDSDPLVVQVVALNWKWLFIYPEQGIAVLNYLQIPERTPIHLKLAADGSPMNSFWIPQLSGQIYAMTGMATQLYLMADGIGEYTGKEVEINGDGYADMTFTVKSTSGKDFNDWVEQVKKSPKHLSEDAYNELVKPHIIKSVILYSEVENDLYLKLIRKYKYPMKPVL